MGMFGWVEFSQEERDRANAVLALAREPGAVDEIGIGAIRDEFSNRLFPGTSTLHTRARYLFLIPYLFKDLEREHRGEPVERLQELHTAAERDTMEKLVMWADANDQGREGIIGWTMYETGGWVKQTPTQMYWRALSLYGLLTDDKARIRDVYGLISGEDAPPRGRRSHDEEDEEEELAGFTGLWNLQGASYGGWNSGDQVPMTLTRAEAQVLGERIIAADERGVYAYLLNQDSTHLQEIDDKSRESGDEYARFVNFIDYLESTGYEGVEDEGARHTCELAASFSSLVALLHIRFNLLIQVKAGSAPNQDGENAEALWDCHFGSGESPYHERALKCDLGAVFDDLELQKSGGQKDAKTYGFLCRSLDALRRKDLGTLDREITERERHVKGEKRSKIRHPGKYCGTWYGGLGLNFRFDIALSFAKEIVAAREGGRDD